MIIYILFFLFITFYVQKSSEYVPLPSTNITQENTNNTSLHDNDTITIYPNKSIMIIGIVLVFFTIILLIIGTLLTIYLRCRKRKLKKESSHIIESTLFRHSSSSSTIIMNPQFKNAIHNATLIPSYPQ